MFVLEFPQCAAICSLYHLICSLTDLESKEKKGKKKKKKTRKEKVYVLFFPTFVVNTKYTVENTVVSTDS